MRFFVFLLISFLVCCGFVRGSRLSISGNNLMFNGKKVFLSGVNFSWNSYGYDFGNGQYNANSKSTFNNWLAQIAANGGNSVRVWVHVEGNNTPNFDSNGYTTSADRTGTLVSDLKTFLDAAKAKNILVVFVLWNGALQRTQNVINLFWDKSKLQSYIDKALTPMVAGVKGHPALAAWEIINEPEGLVYSNNYNSVNCFNTQPLANSGAGWNNNYIPMQQIQLFINWQAAAIKAADPGALVTVGTWSERSITDKYLNARNYYSDACLTAAGGKAAGKLDFYQVHTYATYGAYAPFKVTGASSYGLNKPLVIGEFAASCSGGLSISQLYNSAYNNGFQGAWSWQYAGGYCADSLSTLNLGMTALKGKSAAGGLVNFPVA